MKRDFSSLAARNFDLLVCGGGIYGAWTAYDAALQGLNVAIVEQRDWACATSSASSKLIHGGLRYLENYDFKLVKKALSERQLLLKLAPHRVWPLRFGVPVYASSRVGTLRLKAGLMLYDLLAGFSAKELRHRHLKLRSFSDNFPYLDIAELHGGFTYGDAQTDDARLVLELIAGAMSAGAVCVNYCKLDGLVETDGTVTGAMVKDQLNGNDSLVHAKQFVHTTGQWMAESEQARDWCRLTKGVHLVMPAVLVDDGLVLTAKSDGRVLFMIPWYGMTLIGTTDTDYDGNPDHVSVDPKDVAYLLAEANNYLNISWTEQDVIGSYAGVRVMKQSDKASPSSVSRDWEIKTAANGAHYSIGGKLTSSREDAASIVSTVCARLDIDRSCVTGKLLFPWAPENNYSGWSAAVSAEAIRLGIDQESAKWLIRRHGKRAGEVLRSIGRDPSLAERITPTLPFVYADLLFCAQNEMVIHLDDLLRRRLPLLILAKLNQNTLRRIAEMVAQVMDWDEATMNREVEACRPK